MLPFSQAAENNREVIADTLSDYLTDTDSLLEIASGTGQHAVYMGGRFPHLKWQPSDIPAQVTTLQQRLDIEAPANVLPGMGLDVGRDDWGLGRFDAIFSANCVHIISWPLVQALFRGVGRHLNAGGRLFLYGPYKYHGEFTTDSNARFDLWLKDRDPNSGVRDFEAVNDLAQAEGLVLAKDHVMPANNQLLVWQRSGD